MNTEAYVEIGTIVNDNKFGPFKIIHDFHTINGTHNVLVRFENFNMYGFHTIRKFS